MPTCHKLRASRPSSCLHTWRRHPPCRVWTGHSAWPGGEEPMGVADQQFAGDRKGLAEGLSPPPPPRSCPRHLLSSHLFGERSTCQGNAGVPLNAGLDVLPRELVWTRGLRVAAIARYNFCNKWFPWVWMCLLGSCFRRLCCDFLLPSALSTCVLFTGHAEAVPSPDGCPWSLPLALEPPPSDLCLFPHLPGWSQGPQNTPLFGCRAHHLLPPP